MIPRYRLYEQRLRTDWPDVRRAATRAKDVYGRGLRSDVDEEAFVEAAALNLHAFYSGLERTFEWIARELDGAVPRSDTWHRDLLDQMALQIPDVRPAVLGPATRTMLDDFMRFRHRIRHLYAWDISSERVAQLIAQVPHVIACLDADLEAFADFLDAASEAD